MKALTIKQPWVHAILHEVKDIENRSWQHSYRGWIALRASAQPAPAARFPRGVPVPELNGLDYSTICGVARLTDIVTRSRSKWFDRVDYVNYGWVLSDVQALKTPIPCKGSLGLWEVPPTIVRSIKRQLPRLRLEEPPSRAGAR
jgi:hypothetical protein